ncbi:putative zinc-binding protein [Aliidiomarina indica]|uniref:putative zinc-binding protein n=1 Tax=Aliidiomarina indica TaxID=2749147 RepID=UPI00188EE98E|nr:putative zinc-binding protein [Aliidiomarina indica]
MSVNIKISESKSDKPLVYSCSGCSNVAQLANDIAVRLSRDGIAEMSCIAGVGGNVRPLVRTACSGRNIIALDGCPLACVKHSLKRVGVEPTWHIELTRMGLKKQDHQDCSIQETFQALSYVYQQLGVKSPD